MTQIYVGMPSATGFPYPETIFNIFYQDVNDVDLLFDMNSLVLRSPIQIARNDLVQRFLQTEAEYLWFCDDDNPPDIGVLQKLIDADKDIITALVPLRMGDKEGEVLNIFYIDETGSRVNYKDITEEAINIIEIANCGTGCVLIKREVVEMMNRAYKERPFAFEDWDYIRNKLDEKIEKYKGQDYDSGWEKKYIQDPYSTGIKKLSIPLSEDVCFFERCKELGYKIYAELTAECYHFNARPIKRKISNHFISKK